MRHVLYLTRNGLLEPLGYSQVFAYLRGLSRTYQITVVSFEKSSDWADKLRVNSMRIECQRHNIRWLPQRFVSRPKVIAPLLSIVRMILFVSHEVLVKEVRLIHARSYIPAVVAFAVGRLTSVPFIFDMRALWPEELITAGRLRRGSLLHLVIVFAERVCVGRAGAVVSLTHSAVRYLAQTYPAAMTKQTVAVIPTCADLARFAPAPKPKVTKVIGCLGTLLSGWFRVNWLANFVKVAAHLDPELRFEFTTMDDPDLVRKAIGGGAELQSRFTVMSCPADKVHEVLRGQLASVMFYAGGEISELGRCPTRMAEILGCGLPVVANEGVGDVAEIIREYQVGILVTGPTEAEMSVAWAELQDLLADPELSRRCRLAAEKVFSLESGTDAYASLYANILERHSD